MGRQAGTGRHGRPRRLARAALGLVAAASVSAAGADSIEGRSATAVPAGTSLSDAKWAFDQHSKSWMADLEKIEAENRRTAPVYSVASESVIRFDGYGDDWETQVKETGHHTAPFVGILRYKENVYTCMRDDESRCTVTSSVPVSEIFSFRNGRWTY